MDNALSSTPVTSATDSATPRSPLSTNATTPQTLTANLDGSSSNYLGGASADQGSPEPRDLRSEPNSRSSESQNQIDAELTSRLDRHSLEAVVDLKLARFLDQIGSYYPENLHALIMKKVEKQLLNQILRRTGGNQVHASRILGINRNTLRKKMKLYGLAP